MRSVHGTNTTKLSLSREEMMEENVAPPIEEKIYVAVGKDVAKNKSTLIWALENAQGNKICIIHVHQPPQIIPVFGKKFQTSTAHEQIVTAKILEEYVQICHQKGVQAEKLCVEMDSTGSGIVQLISLLNVRKLVMGAAEDKSYSMRMTDLRSKKAIFVRRLAPATCHIWFTCKGHLICTREATMHGSRTLSTLLSEFQHLVSRVKSSNPFQDILASDSLETENEERAMRNSSSSRLPGLSNVKEKSNHSSSPIIPDGTAHDEVYDQIQQALAEARISKQDALAEALRRQEAEKRALDASRMAKEYESAYFEEMKRREEAELELANQKEEHLKITSLFVDQVAEYDRMVKELQQQSDSALELLQRVTIERDIALSKVEELRRTLTEPSAPPLPMSFIFSEIVIENHQGLTGEIPEALEPTRASFSTDEYHEAPPYFKCPIFHDVMRYPHVAADGFTYEKEAIRTWLNTGHNTSPMTNEKLAHTSLIPNRPLRSAIQEWLQQRNLL